MKTKTNEFDIIWQDVIKPLIESFCENLGVKCKPIFFTKLILKCFYHKQKKRLIKVYMGNSVVNIDRHKVAAILMKAILLFKPLYIPFLTKVKFVFSTEKYLCNIIPSTIVQNKKESEKINIEKYYTYLNEYLSLSIAVSVLDGYINSDNSENRFKHEIVVPDPFPKPDEDYLLDICISLSYSGVSRFNPIIFANALFLWEKYSCRKKQFDELNKKYNELLVKQKT